ncbi:MAG: outer membrane beta-barrel protein [Bacteroidetes bacterium]|nr:outer membrane beta-barrel protein [Bacteroidota bacterium]
MKQNWEKQIKSSLGEFQKLPERDLWPEIERKLNKDNKKRPLIIPLFWKTGAIVATAASLALIILLNPTQEFRDNSLSQIDQIDQNTQNSEQRSSTVIETNERNNADESLVVAPWEPSTTHPDDNNSAEIPERDSNEITLAAASQSDNGNNLIASNSPNSAAAAQKKTVAVSGNNKNIAEQIDLIEPPKVITNTAVSSVVTVDPSKVEASNSDETEEDSTAAPEVVNALTGPVTSLVAQEDLEEIIINDSQDKAWSIMPVAGPVYYNSLTQGSVFDQSFSDNSRQGDITFSYGLRVNIDLDKRLTLRTGINSVAMGYATQGIEIATGPAAFGLSTVNYSDNRNIISVFDKGTLSANPNPTNPYSQLNLKSTSGDLALRANLNYLEFPLELSYALIDQQVKLSLISGVSGLILNNNEVSVNDGQNRYVLGNLNNLNQFSFSTNIGFGLSYKVFQRLNLQLEPTFKYQLGTYSDPNVDFTPYQLVLLSGLQFQF